jgi:hypothetical protein
VTAVAGVARRRHAGLDYIERLEGMFELSAERAEGAPEFGLQIGGCPVRFRFAGDALRRVFLSALSNHPGCAPDVAKVTICAVDLAAAGMRLPPFPWSPVDVRERGEVRGFNDDRLRTLYEVDSGMLSMLDVARGRAFLAVDDERRLLWWQRAAPLRTIFHWVLTSPTRTLVHAGAVGDDAGAVLLAGAGGSGKSTTAVACAAAGLRYAGDDYVLLEIGDAPVVHSLYSTAKLTDESLAMLPPLGDSLLPESLEDEKRVVYMDRAFPHAIAPPLPVRAIAVPRVTPGRATRLMSASAADALRALAPTTIYQLPSNGGRALGQLAELVRRVKAFSLGIGEDTSAPPLIAQLLQGTVDVHD